MPVSDDVLSQFELAGIPPEGDAWVTKWEAFIDLTTSIGDFSTTTMQANLTSLLESYNAPAEALAMLERIKNEVNAYLS